MKNKLRQGVEATRPHTDNVLVVSNALNCLQVLSCCPLGTLPRATRDSLPTAMTEHQDKAEVLARSVDILSNMGGCSAPEVDWWCRKLLSNLSEDVKRCQHDVRFAEPCFSAVEAFAVNNHGIGGVRNEKLPCALLIRAADLGAMIVRAMQAGFTSFHFTAG